METHAFGFRLRANAPEGQKRFPISHIASVGSKQVAQGGRREPAIPARQCACGGICPRCHTPPNAQSLLDAIGDEGMGPRLEPHVLSSGGQPFSPSARAFFERSFGQDLGQVRLHRDGDADRRSRALGARAFTVGRDIFFRNRAYDPESVDGFALLAHELTHVIQQGGRHPSSPWPMTSRESPVEHEAGRVATAVVAGRAVPPITTGAVPAVSLVTDDELAARSDWAALSPEERERILSSGGPGYEEIKKAIIAGLIDAITTARQGYLAFLRDQASNLSPNLQSGANALIDLVEVDLELLSVLLFFELGVVIGFGEGLAQMVIGLLRIAWAVLEFVVHAVMGLFGRLDLLAEDLVAMEMAWHDLCYLDFVAILEAWLAKFEAAPAEGKAAMVGEFVGEVLAFVATWQTSSSRLSKLLPPPSAAAPQLVAAVAGGGTMAVPLAQPAADAVALLGPTLGGLGPAGIQVMNMSGQGPDDSESKAGATTAFPGRAGEKGHGARPRSDRPGVAAVARGRGARCATTFGGAASGKRSAETGKCDDRRLRGAAARGGQRRPGLHPDVRGAREEAYRACKLEGDARSVRARS